MNKYGLAQLDQCDKSPVRREPPRSFFVRRNECAEIYMGKVSPATTSDIIPECFRDLFPECSDVCPEQRPDGLPPTRTVNFEVEMKPDAILSSRAPFRLS